MKKPKYREIIDILQERIKNNIYPIDSFLPSQIDLAEEFNVSRMTIKKAIDVLILQGILSSKRGSGTKVLNYSFWENDTALITEYEGLSKQMGKRGVTVESEILHFEVLFPEKDIQKRLKIDITQPIYKIVRLRMIKNEPYVLEYTYMPCHLVPHLSDDVLRTSVYSYLHNELNIHFSGAYRNIKAAKADHNDIKYLNCQIHDPVLEVEQIIYLKDGIPIEYSKSRNRFDIRGYTMLDMEK